MAVRIEKNQGVTTIILSRPDVRNAVDRHTAEELACAFRQFEADTEARAAVLYGDHGVFCSGADLKAIAAGQSNRAEPTGDGPMGPTRMVISKPVIAAIAGYAVAGGLELALLCDLRVMEEAAVLGVFNRRWGVPLIDGGTVRLPRIIGLGRALDLILTGRPVHSDEALAIGLVNRVVPNGASRRAAEDIAAQLAGFPQAGLRGDRLSVYEQFGLPFDTAMANEFMHGQEALSEEGPAGARLFAGGAGRHGDFTHEH